MSDRPNFPLIDTVDACPPPCAQEDKRDPIVHVKLFCPWGAATWWITEYDPSDRTAFGYAFLGDPYMAELGFVSLDELESITGIAGLTIERDVHFKPKPLSEALKAHGLDYCAAQFA